jgi:hypothetical protein
MKLTKRNVLAYLLAQLLIMSGRIRKIHRRTQNGDFILSIYFHNPSKALFENTVQWFLKRKYRFLSVKELIDILKSQKSFPSSCVIFTVDDGWKENKENIFSVAKKYSIPVTLFATVDPIGKQEGFWWSYISKAYQQKLIPQTVQKLKDVPNSFRRKAVLHTKQIISIQGEAVTIEDLKEMKQQSPMDIGSHTLSHPILTKCSEGLARREIIESKNVLEKWINHPITSFAYPNGNYSTREIDILKENGYEIAFSTQQKYLANHYPINMYAIPRFDVLEEVSFAENICRMTGVWFYRKSKKR